jgi:hypothetical protein
MTVGARLILTMLAAVIAVAVACGDDGTPQSPTPTLSEEEAWALVQDKLITACPKYGNGLRWSLMFKDESTSSYTQGRWDFTWKTSGSTPTLTPLQKAIRDEFERRGQEPPTGLLPTPTAGIDVQLTVYEATHTVTGNAAGLYWLSGPPDVCR